MRRKRRRRKSEVGSGRRADDQVVTEGKGENEGAFVTPTPLSYNVIMGRSKFKKTEEEREPKIYGEGEREKEREGKEKSNSATKS